MKDVLLPVSGNLCRVRRAKPIDLIKAGDEYPNQPQAGTAAIMTYLTVIYKKEDLREIDGTPTPKAEATSVRIFFDDLVNNWDLQDYDALKEVVIDMTTPPAASGPPIPPERSN